MEYRVQRAVTVWAIAAGVLILWLAYAHVGNRIEARRHDKDAAAAAKVEQFYLVVAGERQGLEPGPMNKLARDLHDLSALDVFDFRGDSNRYGGITSELGFDPFDGPNCSECGRLDHEVLMNVEDIKDGGIDGVINEIEADIHPEVSRSGPPAFLWLLWVVSLPAYVGIDFTLVRRREEARYRDFTHERHLVDELKVARGTLPEGSQRQSIDHLIEGLESQIEARVTYAQAKKRDMRLEALVADATEALGGIEAGNRELN